MAEWKGMRQYYELVEKDGDYSRKEGQILLNAEALLSYYKPA